MKLADLCFRLGAWFIARERPEPRTELTAEESARLAATIRLLASQYQPTLFERQAAIVCEAVNKPVFHVSRQFSHMPAYVIVTSDEETWDARPS